VKVLAGESVISPEMMTKFVAVFRAKQPGARNGGNPVSAPADAPGSALGTLSAREREILAFIARGDSNKVIARALDIAETTVKVHVQHILRKLQLTSRVQVAIYAAGRGMV
jgi:two-component system, NarL family, nitrate/nitrite response regulator NarL